MTTVRICTKMITEQVVIQEQKIGSSNPERRQNNINCTSICSVRCTRNLLQLPPGAHPYYRSGAAEPSKRGNKMTLCVRLADALSPSKRKQHNGQDEAKIAKSEDSPKRSQPQAKALSSRTTTPSAASK